MSKRHRKVNPLFYTPKLPQELREGLEEAEFLLSKQFPLAAIERLSELNTKYPHHKDVLELFSDALYEIEDHQSSLAVLLELDKLEPNTSWVKIRLAESYLKNGFQCLALQTFYIVLDKWSGAEETPQIRRLIPQLENSITYSTDLLKFSFDEGIKFFAKHEELQIFMRSNDFERCKQLGKELLTQRPRFVPVLNNLSHISWHEGDIHTAIKQLENVLEFDPENLHALSTIIEYQFMVGDLDHVDTYSKQLLTTKIFVPTQWSEKIIALGIIRNYEEIIRLFEQEIPKGDLKYCDAEIWHWRAVAEYRVGHPAKARTYWKKCLLLAPYFSLAQTNLNEMELENKNERMCPQEFSIHAWISEAMSKNLLKALSPESAKENIDEVKTNVEKLIKKYPELLNFIEVGLTSGDRGTREFIIELIDLADVPQILNRIKFFPLGKEGPESLRLKIAQLLTRYGVYNSGQKIKFWSHGNLRSILLMGFDIVFEANGERHFSHQVSELMEKGYFALRDGNGKKAEGIFRIASGLCPEEPSLLNNLAHSLQMQGKSLEAETLADEIIKKFPDYFFSQIMVIKKAIAARDFHTAGLFLEKIMTRKELHITEFNALCSCQIELGMAEGKIENIDSWMDIWSHVDPENPTLKEFRKLLN